jgi:TonB family protein
MKKSVILLISFALISTAAVAGINIDVENDKVAKTQVNSFALPLSQRAPLFPVRLARYGREGYTVVEYQINAQGEVVNAQVIENEGGVEFARASLKALSKWRFKPQNVNGSSTIQSKIRVQFDFNNNAQKLSDLISDENFHKTTFNVLAKG